MTSIARSMKRHGLTSKPSLRLISAVESGGEKHYVFDMNDEGLRHTVSAADFWRGAGKHSGVDLATPPAAPPLPTSPMPPPPPEPSQPAVPAPAPSSVQREYICVRDMKPGDVVLPPGTKKARPREVVRVVRGVPTFDLHYVWEGSAALRTSRVVPGAKFVLLKQGDR